MQLGAMRGTIREPEKLTAFSNAIAARRPGAIKIRSVSNVF